MNLLKSCPTVLAAFTLSLAAGLFACSGSDPTLAEAPSPSGEATSDNDGTNNPNPTTSSSSGAPSIDAGAGADAAPLRTLALHCPTTSNDPTLCLETGEGKAGDVVDLEVHLVGSASCPAARQAYGQITIDPAYFELVNAGSHVDCTSRAQIPNVPGQEVIAWQKFGDGAIPGCNDLIGSGNVDTLEVRIKPGTPPGDYTFGWEVADFMGTTLACSTMGNYISGVIRVLP